MKNLQLIRAIKYSILLLSLCFSLTKITAQLSTEDSAFHKKAVNNMVNVYHQSMGNESVLFNGQQYGDYPKFKDGGHAFFNTTIPSNCTIVYDNVFYPNVHLLYDEIKGLIVVQDGLHRIQLQTDKVARFTIWDNLFVHIIKDSSTISTISDGFYQVLYDNKVQLLKQEAKFIEEDIHSVSDGIIRSIKIKKYYFIKKKDVYYAAHNKNDVWAIFNDRKKEVEQYIKRNKLDFGKDADNALIKIATYYDSLTQ